MHQRFFVIPQQQKNRLLITLLKSERIERVLVFTKTKHKADRVARWLRRAHIPADAIHSNRTQSARNTAMRSFREGRVQVLVATDIASRGIDVDDVSHVINFDVPIDPETYVHRIGRTARAGASGTAITFVQQSESGMVHAIERRADIIPTQNRFPCWSTFPNRGRILPRRPSHVTNDAGTGTGTATDASTRAIPVATTRAATAPATSDGDSGNPVATKVKFKKNAGGYNKGGYVPATNATATPDPAATRRSSRRTPADTTRAATSPATIATATPADPAATRRSSRRTPADTTRAATPPRRTRRRLRPIRRLQEEVQKNAGGYNKGGYVPRDERDGDSGRSGGYKKKFKKNAGGQQGRLRTRDERDGDFGRSGGYKKKFKKNAGGQGRLRPPRRSRRSLRQPGGHKKKFKKASRRPVQKSGMSGGSKGHARSKAGRSSPPRSDAPFIH